MVDRQRLLLARGDLGEFSRLIDRPLTDTQAGALQLRRRVSALVAPRQTGKSRSLAVLALHQAFRMPIRVLVISAGEEAARRLLAEVRDIALSSPLLAGSVVDEAAALVTLSNGSEIRSVPASERQIRGWTVDLLIVDEAPLVDDELILGAAFPTTAARPDARIVLAGSPLGTSGAFYTFATQGWSGSEHVATFRWRLADAPWITAETVAQLREGLTERRAAAELDGVFVDLDADERLIDREWIDRAQRLELQPCRRGVVAVDVARFGSDRTVAYVVRGGVVRQLFEGRGWNTMATASRLAGVMREQLQAPPEHVTAVVDDTGVGGGVTDRARQLGVPVTAFIGAARADRPDRFANARAENHWRLRKALEAGELDLDSDDRELAEQLAGLRLEYDATGRVLIESKESMRSRGVSSPDRSDALVMAMRSPLWRPVAQLSSLDESRELLAQMDAARAAAAWAQTGDGWMGARNREDASMWRAVGLDF